jgi:glyoxylate reductase
MASGKLRIVVTRRLPDAVEQRLAACFDAELNQDDRPLTRDGLAAAMARADVLAPAVPDRIDAALIEGAGPRLRLIANFGAGTDNIDLDAARARGIAVTNTPGVLTEDTADIAMALILMAARRLGEGERILRAGRWRGWGPTDQLGTALSAKRLGIVGMGRIGGALAARARAFGMDVRYHNRRPIPGAPGYEADLDRLVAEADFLSLNAPYGPATHHLIDSRRLASMKPGAFLINTARGGLVDEEALVAALEAGAIAGAGLDVFANEPDIDPRLVAAPNVVLIPHLGSATIETRTAMGMKVADNIEAFAAGRPLPDRVV